MKKVIIGILGFGTVGAGIYKIIRNDCAAIEAREGLSLEVKRVLIKDFDCEPNLGLAPRELFVTSIDAMLAEDDINIVVECMGGVEPARTFILKALHAGKTVVTSNKEVIAKHWPEFEAAAKANGAGLYIEATAGGGIPVIRTLIDAMQANTIESIMGIVNGTTNYILSNMTEVGLDYADVLREAQQLGYAEANPASDVEGWDSVYKLSILASMAFNEKVPIDAIYREGITGVTNKDIALAKDLGYVIKLLAIGKRTADGIQVRVHPTMVPKEHPIASVRGPFNAIFLTGNNVGELMLYGRGAGQMPTASAILSDVLYAAHAAEHTYSKFDNSEAARATNIQSDWISEFFIRLLVSDKPGVLEKIAGIFAQNAVSLHSVLQRGVTGEEASLIFVTHPAGELAVREAIKGLRQLECVREVENIIRVER